MSIVIVRNPRPHPLRDANSGNLFPTLAPGGLLPRRQAISGLRRSAESSGEGNYAHRSTDLLYLRFSPALARAGGMSAGGEVGSRPPVVSAKGLGFFRGHSSHVTSRDLARTGFQRPRTGCTHPKNPQTLCGMGESNGVNVQNPRLGYGELDAYGFHTLEALQCMVERR